VGISAETDIFWKAAQQFKNGDPSDDDVIVSEEVKTIVFKFDAVQPKSVTWDPRVGVIEDSPTSVNAAPTISIRSVFINLVTSFIFGYLLI